MDMWNNVGSQNVVANLHLHTPHIFMGELLVFAVQLNVPYPAVW